ncbi:MAG: hypothetical protein JWM53_7001, partial [bacterium]|nr:hypothetical protein [bacterium]
MVRVSVVVAALGFCAAARAELPSRLVVAGATTCPTAAAVGHAMERLHPKLRVEIGDGDGTRIEISDEGARYVVRAAGRERALGDEGRRCGDRATAAALAATLLL